MNTNFSDPLDFDAPGITAIRRRATEPHGQFLLISTWRYQGLHHRTARMVLLDALLCRRLYDHLRACSGARDGWPDQPLSMPPEGRPSWLPEETLRELAATQGWKPRDLPQDERRTAIALMRRTAAVIAPTHAVGVP